MRLEKTLAKYPFVLYNPAEHMYVGFFDMMSMIEYYEAMYKVNIRVNGVMFFEHGREIKL